MTDATGTPTPTPPAQAPRKRWWIGALLVALLVAVLALAWWLWKQWSADMVAAGDAAQLQALLEKNKSLRAELEGIKPPEKPICKPGEMLQEIPGGAGPGIGGPPMPPGSAPAPLSGPPTGALSSADLAQKLELATALVVVAGDNSLSTGSGFFISPQLLVTNQHVVEGAVNGRVYLTSKSLKAVRRGTVLKSSGTSQTGSADFALVRMDDGSAPGTLDMSPEVAKLTAVVAAGYPAVVTQNDPNFRKLVEGGDGRAAPDLSVVRGEIQSLQNSAQGVAQLVHTAPISGGNSGGPLVDACGRVIGVNTFIAVDQKQSARVSYAISARAMSDFVSSAGAAVRNDARACK